MARGCNSSLSASETKQSGSNGSNRLTPTTVTGIGDPLAAGTFSINGHTDAFRTTTATAAPAASASTATGAGTISAGRNWRKSDVDTKG